ncbi:MAG: STAS domain-containing protein [Victivallaceae bacterium]|nr:STAS domain-containing protein [Victivallaceae bacterium]
MKISMQKNNGKLQVAVEGSVDTITAPELSAALKGAWRDITALDIDFAAVDYVSSAGLRVVMEADKYMTQRGGMIIRNLNSDVKEVFEMTGFDELLTIE